MILYSRDIVSCMVIYCTRGKVNVTCREIFVDMELFVNNKGLYQLIFLKE